MDGFDPMNSFGTRVADSYETVTRGDEDEAADFLAGLADGRPALELAIGTGRIAFPLLERGVEVAGVDQSQAMLDVLARHPRAAEVRVLRGDMASEAPDGTYGLVYLVFNTIGNVLTQDGQVQIFRNAASRLHEDGCFVIENLTPWHSVPSDQFVHAESVGADEVVLDVNRYDRATQMLAENHVHISADGIRMGPIAQRLTTPGELDLMARLAGLRLAERYGGWRREPFTGDSVRHVSVYAR